MQPFTGVVLAGGASRRMGRDKARIKVGGITLLAHMRALLLESGAQEVVILGRGDVPGGRPDGKPFAGPAAALSDYLGTVPMGSRHLVVPVDMPGLTPDLLRRLAGQKHWAYYSTFMLPMLAVANGDPTARRKRLKDLLHIKGAKTLNVPERQEVAFTNLNSPADIGRWRDSGATTKSGVMEHV